MAVAEFTGGVIPRNVTLFFTAPWCKVCKAMKPIVDRVVAEYPKVDVLIVDVEPYGEIATSLHVQGLPTLVRFVDGEPVAVLTGSRSFDEIETFVTKTG